MKQDKT